MKKTIYILFLGDFINAVIALILANLVRFGWEFDLAGFFSQGLPVLFTFPLIILFSSYFSELYDRERLLNRIELGLRISVVLVLSFFILTVIYYLFPSLHLGRGILFAGLLIFGGLQYINHRVIQMSRLYPLMAKRVMILGVGPLAESMERLIQSGCSNYVFVGFINPANELVLAGDRQVVGTLDQIGRAHV